MSDIESRFIVVKPSLIPTLSRSSSPDVPLINLKEPRLPMAVHTELGTPSEWSLDGKQDNQEYNQPEIARFTSPVFAFSSAVENTKAQPPQVGSTLYSRSPSPSAKAANARHGRPPFAQARRKTEENSQQEKGEGEGGGGVASESLAQEPDTWISH